MANNSYNRYYYFVFIYTGNIGNSFKIGFIELFTKIFLFYLHERLWLKIKWGRKQKLPEIVSPDENVIDEVFDTAPIYEETHARSFIKGIS